MLLLLHLQVDKLRVACGQEKVFEYVLSASDEKDGSSLYTSDTEDAKRSEESATDEGISFPFYCSLRPSLLSLSLSLTIKLYISDAEEENESEESEEAEKQDDVTQSTSEEQNESAEQSSNEQTSDNSAGAVTVAEKIDYGWPEDQVVATSISFSLLTFFTDMSIAQLSGGH